MLYNIQKLKISHGFRSPNMFSCHTNAFQVCHIFESMNLKGLQSLSYDLYMHIISSSKEPFYQGFCGYTFEHVSVSWYTLYQGLSCSIIIGILKYSFEHVVISWYTPKLELFLLFLDMISSFCVDCGKCIVLAHQKSLPTKLFLGILLNMYQ